MIETRVRVVAARPGVAWVEPSEPAGCGACQASGQCAISGLGRFLSGRRPPIAIACEGARAGEERTLAVSEADLLRAGLFAYLLPVVLAVGAAALAGQAGQSDSIAALAATAGLLGGLLLGRRFGRPATLTPIESHSTTSGEHP